MGNLSNLYISESYQSLIHLGSDGAASTTLTQLQDGLGNGLGVYVNTLGQISASGNIYAANLTGSTINTGSLTTTASFNAFTQSYYTDSASFSSRINAATGSTINTSSFATTGSNTFVGNQTINGTLIVTGSSSELRKQGGTFDVQDDSGVVKFGVYNNASLIQANYPISASAGLFGTASYATNANLLDGYNSTDFVFSSSYSVDSASFSSRINAITASGGIPAGTVSSSTQISDLGFINQTQTASMAVSSSTYALTSSYALVAGNGGVTQLFAGPNVTLSPVSGLGQVTISSTGTGTYYNTATGSYGSFYDTGSYPITSITTAYSASLNTTDITNGVFISGSDKTKIFFSNAGVYNVQFSAQFTSSNNSIADVDIWLRRGNDGGTSSDLDFTKGQLTVPAKSAGVNGAIIAGWNYFVTLNANDYLQLMYNAKDTGIALHTFPVSTNPTTPVSPSLILTAQRVDTFLSNTGSFTGSFGGLFSGTLTGTASNASLLNNTSSIAFATSASLNSLTASFNTISASYLAFTQSYYSDSSSFDSRINGKISGVIVEDDGAVLVNATALNFGSNLAVSVAGLTASVSTLGLATTSSVDSLSSKTGSYATTGSNTFRGNQTITSSAGNTTITPQAITNTSNGVVSALNSYAVSQIVGSDEFGFTIDTTQYGVSGWTGPAIYGNDPSDLYPAFFGFQNRAAWTDGRVTALTPLIVTQSLSVVGNAQFSSSVLIKSGSASGSLISNVGDTFTGTAAVTKIISLSSAEYSGLATKDSNTLYIII